MLTRRAALMGAAGIAALPILTKAAASEEIMDTSMAEPVDLSSLERIQHKLVRPPMVHPHEQIAPAEPRVVEFEMRIVEKEVEVDNGAYLQAMTFNGSIPGPMMVVHEGDYVELTLYNSPENLMQHNIDFHSATGALGGGSLTLVNPGEKTVLLQSDTARHLCLSLCTGRPDDPLARRLWHVGRDHGPAPRRAARPRRQSGDL